MRRSSEHARADINVDGVVAVPGRRCEGGVLEFEFRLELHVYRRLVDDELQAAWLNDDATYYRSVEVGRT